MLRKLCCVIDQRSENYLFDLGQIMTSVVLSSCVYQVQLTSLSHEGVGEDPTVKKIIIGTLQIILKIDRL